MSGVALVTPQATTTVYAGKTAQAAGNWVFTVPSNVFTASDTITFQIAPPAGNNCASVGQTIGFASTPTVAVVATSTSTTGTAPTISAATSLALGESPLCTSLGIKDLLTLTFTNSASSPTNAGTYTITVSGVSYNIGSAAGTGPVSVIARYNNGVGGSGYVSGTAPNTTTTPTTYPASNASITNVEATANSPAVALTSSALDKPISDVVVSESTPGAVTANYVCVTLTTTGASFDAASAPTVSASGGGAAAGSATRVSSTVVSFNVTTASTTGPATFTLGGLTLDAPAALGPVLASVVDGGTSSSCATSTGTVSTSLRLAAVTASTQTYGTNADGSAAATFQKAYPPISACASGVPTGGNPSAVLATNADLPDALSASYLAGNLKTGILLTPTNSLSTNAINVLRLEGVATVYIVGGPLAVSDAVQTQLEGTQAWGCSSNSYGPLFTTAGTPQDIHVIRVYGQDRYGTAQQVAEFFGSSEVGSADFSAAYNTANGDSSTAVIGTPYKTAILATGENFRDAMSASPVAFVNNFPIILTTSGALSSEASSTLVALGIQQVIVMGGTAAVSANVVTAVQGMGILTHRIGGADGTDTAQMLAQFEIQDENPAGVANGLNWWVDNKTALLVRGDFYPDGLTGSVWAGKNYDPILLTESPSTLGQYTTAFLNMAGGLGVLTWGAPLTGIYTVIYAVNVIGGPLAVNPSTIAAAQQAISEG